MLDPRSLLLAFLVPTRSARTESGATAVEYGLLVGFIALAIITAVVLLGGNLLSIFSTVASKTSR